MNKSKVILSSVGGVALVASLVLAYLIWSALSEKGEKTGDLESAEAMADRLVRLPVYPGPEGIKAYKANAETYEAWREDAVKVASVGDMAFERTTPPAFKAFLVDDARRLSALPGAVNGRLVQEDFPFGFKDYITGGVLPAQGDLARLQREWHDVSTVVEALARCGVMQVVDVTMKSAAPAVQEEAPAKKGKMGKKPAKAAEPAAAGPDVTSFTVVFLTRPAGLVNAINEFMTMQRFVVVDDFSFQREKDDIAEALSGDGKKQQETQQRGRRGRRGRQAEEEAEKPREDKGPGVVTDPATASPIRVAMTFSVYDFRSLAGGQDESGERKSEESK